MMKKGKMTIFVKVVFLSVLMLFLTACGASDTQSKTVKQSEVDSYKLLNNDREWKSFGSVWGDAIHRRTYNNEQYIYVATIAAGSGLYSSVSTEVGKTYKVTAELLGADINRNENFLSNSYLTVSSAIPRKDERSVIAVSEYVSGGEKVTKEFTFVATGTTSYIAIRSDNNWQYANARAITIVDVEDDSSIPTPPETDTTAPLITLNGVSEVEVLQGSAYSDAGATATDNVDGDISPNIVVVSNVDTTTIGTYTITYNVKDTANNQAVEITRVVNVVASDSIPSTSCTELLSNNVTWTSFGVVWGNAIYSRSYNNELFIYVATVKADSGLYSSVATEVGKTYQVTAELLGADINRNENFLSNSYVTVSSAVPSKDERSVIASSEYVTGGEKVSIAFTFIATGTTSYIAIRSDSNWQYASARALSVKELAEECGEAIVPPIEITPPIRIDRTAPVITLNGASEIEVSQGSSYNDAGVTVTDDVDGDITANVVVINPVDTTTVGTYTIIYNVKDGAGNKAVEISRIVHVVEDESSNSSSCSELFGEGVWLAFGDVYKNRAYTRVYNNEQYIYVATIKADSGLYRSFRTEVGKTYQVSAELIGADINRNENFLSNSYITVSSATPAKDRKNVIASSSYVAGGEKVTKIFSFIATSRTSYIAIRSDSNWQYASARAVSVKELAQECDEVVSLSAVGQLLEDSAKGLNGNVHYIVVGDSTRNYPFVLEGNNKTNTILVDSYYREQLNRIGVAFDHTAYSGIEAYRWKENIAEYPGGKIKFRLQDTLNKIPSTNHSNYIVEFSLGINDARYDTTTRTVLKATIKDAIEILHRNRQDIKILMVSPVSYRLYEEVGVGPVTTDIIEEIYKEVYSELVTEGANYLAFVSGQEATKDVTDCLNNGTNGDTCLYYGDSVHPAEDGSLRLVNYIFSEIGSSEVHTKMTVSSDDSSTHMSLDAMHVDLEVQLQER